MDLPDRLQRLRQLQFLLDNAFRIPGTRLRVGLDPIIGLVPWVGDLLTTAFSVAVLVQANRLRVPRVVQLRMLFNVGLDTVVGAIPFAGDVADAFWKSNARNFALLERHAGAPQSASAGDYAFAIGMLVALLGLALIPLFVLYWLYQVIGFHCC